MLKIKGFSRNGRVIKVLLNKKVFYANLNRLILALITAIDAKTSASGMYLKKNAFGWELYNNTDYLIEWGKPKSQLLLSGSLYIVSDEYFIILYKVRPSHFKKLIAALEQAAGSK